jgi:hypothetical protein
VGVDVRRVAFFVLARPLDRDLHWDFDWDFDWDLDYRATG